jgi:uncharacterized protein
MLSSSEAAGFQARQPAGPIGIAERIEELDILRGFAIFGILVVNMQLFGNPAVQAVLRLGEPTGGIDRAAAWLIELLFEGKFYSLFSFLFGFGLSVQMVRARARGARFVPTYLRRLSVLLLIGLAHGLFLWVGDILLPYAVLGFLLILFRNRAPRTLAIWAAVFLGLSILLQAASLILVEMGRSTPEGAEAVAQMFAGTEGTLRAAAAQAVLIYSGGSLAEIQSQRVADLTFMYSGTLFILPNIFAMFLLGLYAGKRGIFQDIPAHLPFIRRVTLWGLAVGLPASLAYVVIREMVGSTLSPSPLGLAGWSAHAIGAPALSLCYMGSIILLTQDPAWRTRLAPLASVGRMALSNYLLQTLICTTIFYSYGLGLYGQVGAAPGLVLTVGIYLAQIPLSRWWLGRYRFGPMEWLWRSLIYWRRQPMRLEQGVRLAES